MEQDKHRLIIDPADMEKIMNYDREINPFTVAELLDEIDDYETVTEIILPGGYEHQQAALDAAWKEYCQQKET